MPTDHLASVKTAEVCKRFPLTPEGAKLLKPELTPQKFLDALTGGQHFLDAVRFLAHALPKREAVWWACVCARQVADGKDPAPYKAALTAAEKWVSDPNEDNRRATMPAAEAAELATPAGCAAMAAFWSGGSLAPPQNPVVPPADHLTGHGAASSILLAAVRTQPEKAPEKYKKFLAAGLDVAKGTNKWK
jgi:hypothetical protein